MQIAHIMLYGKPMSHRYLVIVCVTIGFFLPSSGAFGALKPRKIKVCEQTLTPAKPLPKIDPIILKPITEFQDLPNYIYEMKYDGFRGIAYFEPNRCRFVSRQGKHLFQFQKFCEAIARELKVESAIFDGEIIAPDPSGRPIFNRMLRRSEPFRYIAFDLLWLNGNDLRFLSLEERRAHLQKILPKPSQLIEEPLAQVGSGKKLFEAMVEHDLEGIVLKRLSDKYTRSTKWYKLKNKEYSQARRRYWRR